MPARSLLFLSSVFLGASLGLALASNASGVTAEDCRGLGFISGHALCSDCDRLEAVVHDAELVSDCRRCCTAEAAGADAARFDKVVLEVCPWHLQGLPSVKEFIDKHAEAFGERIAVKQIPGRPATLKLRNRDGGDREDVRVDAWKTEHLVQFLEKKLKDAPAPSAAGKKQAAAAGKSAAATASSSKK